MDKPYVDQRDGGYWVAGTRVSLDSLIYAFRRGAAPETIRRSFPVLTLEDVYGALTFYLAHEQEIDDYLKRSESELEVQAQQRREQFRSEKPELYERLTKVQKEAELATQ